METEDFFLQKRHSDIFRSGIFHKADIFASEFSGEDVGERIEKHLIVLFFGKMK